jgi:hypothetical protein
MADVLSPAQRRNVERINAAGHARLAFNRKHGREKIVSSSTMKAIQDARLPLDRRAYERKLRELEA